MALRGLARLLGRNNDADERGAAMSDAKTCAAGHVLDPTWEDCPFCASQTHAQEKSAPIPDIPTVHASGVIGAASDRRTRVGDVPAGGRTTKVDAGDDFSPKGQVPDTRRITGVMITYSWHPSGEMFAVREGKNRIGAGSVSDEGHRPCEIQVTADPTMSAEHALILCRHGRYELVDLNSSNGTFLDAEMVSTHAMPLESGAKIKAGNTVFEFLKFTLDATAVGAAPRTAERSEERRPTSGATEIP